MADNPFDVPEHVNRHSCPCIVAGYPQQAVILADGEARDGWVMTYVHNTTRVARARAGVGHP